MMSPAVVTATPAEATPGRVPAADREVVFTVDGTTTYGTLHVPAHRTGQRLRTALLLGGAVHPRPAGLALLQPQAIRLLDLVALQLHAQTAERPGKAS
jgi:hypothetical protein